MPVRMFRVTPRPTRTKKLPGIPMADANKLKSFLDQNKLNTKRVLAVSHKLETLQVEDRKIVMIGFEILQAIGGGLHAVDGVSFRFQAAKQNAQKPALIFYDQYICFRHVYIRFFT